MRAPKKSIYLYIDSVADCILHLLSGEYKFHSFKNEVPVFVRKGGKVDNLLHPYYLSYSKLKGYDGWCLRDERFLKGSDMDKIGIWMKLSTEGYPLIVCLDPNNLIKLLRN